MQVILIYVNIQLNNGHYLNWQQKVESHKNKYIVYCCVFVFFAFYLASLEHQKHKQNRKQHNTDRSWKTLELLGKMYTSGHPWLTLNVLDATDYFVSKKLQRRCEQKSPSFYKMLRFEDSSNQESSANNISEVVA